jgi:hypothetical protein
MIHATLALRSLGSRIGGDDQARDSAGDGDRDDPRSHARQRESHRHLVPFVVRQPATSNYVY